MKTKKARYRCDTCGEEFYATIVPKLCQFCGSNNIYNGSRKSKTTAEKYIEELNDIIPEMNSLSSRLTMLYVKYMKAHETLKIYVARGIVDGEDVPKFTKPNMTKAFYDSRKSKCTRVK